MCIGHVRVLSYNVLAQNLVRRELFPYASQPCLKWKVRSQQLLTEVLEHEPDVVCLQECSSFDSFWQPKMALAGFEGVFAKRSDSKMDGCAVFFRKSVLGLVDATVVNYNDEEVDPTLPFFMTHNVAQLVRLQHLPTQTPFVVTNTHLFWRPHYNYLRLRQVHQLLRAVNQLPEDSGHVIVCGDFNVTPNDALYEILTKGQLSEGQARDDLFEPCHPLHTDSGSDSEDESVASGSTGKRIKTTESILGRSQQHDDALARINDLLQVFDLSKHPLTSAYGTYLQLDPRHSRREYHPSWCMEPPFTNYSTWTGTLDYILHTTRTNNYMLRVDRVLAIPTTQEVTVQTALPNDFFGSDHLKKKIEKNSMHAFPLKKK